MVLLFFCFFDLFGSSLEIPIFQYCNFANCLESKVADKDWGEGTVQNKTHTSCEGTLAKVLD